MQSKKWHLHVKAAQFPFFFGNHGFVQNIRERKRGERAGRAAEIDEKRVGAVGGNGQIIQSQRAVAAGVIDHRRPRRQPNVSAQRQRQIFLAVEFLIQQITADKTVFIFRHVDDAPLGVGGEQRRNRLGEIDVENVVFGDVIHHFAGKNHATGTFRGAGKNEVFVGIGNGRLGEGNVKHDEPGAGSGEIIDDARIIIARVGQLAGQAGERFLINRDDGDGHIVHRLLAAQNKAQVVGLALEIFKRGGEAKKQRHDSGQKTNRAAHNPFIAQATPQVWQLHGRSTQLEAKRVVGANQTIFKRRVRRQAAGRGLQAAAISIVE